MSSAKTSATAPPGGGRPRPLSPHIGVYKPQISSFTSITHRATGVFLSIGCVVLVFWLWSVAYDPAMYVKINECFRGLVGQIALIAWSAAFFYHLLNGLRHLCWDIGFGYSLPVAAKSGWFVILGSVVLTAIAWLYALGMIGGV